MGKNNMRYIENDEDSRIIQTEKIFTPFLIGFPLLISCFLIYLGYSKGCIMGDPSYFGELFLGLIILFGNLLFDIPFLKNLFKPLKK